jgi:hypothetical protein
MPSSPSDTERWYLKYTVGGKQHTAIMRTLSGSSHTTVSNGFDLILGALTADLYAITIDSLEVSLLGSNVRNPATYGAGSSYGAGGEPATGIPKFISFVGRDSLGHKNRISFYGWKGLQPDDFRINAGEAATIDDAIANLNLSPTIWITIGGGTTLWHSYANFGLSAYWQRRLRG